MEGPICHGPRGYPRSVTRFDLNFCFYDDPDFRTDADSDSRKLQEWHRHLWSKPPRPELDALDWRTDVEFPCLVLKSARGDFRLSSDTIASTHNRYLPELWSGLSPTEQSLYDRGFYRIGGFIVFPRHMDSINQLRGKKGGSIEDRFDLTLECIRRYYIGQTNTDRNPLGEVLVRNSTFFDLFGSGLRGFVAYVDFFHLGDLIGDGSIRWLDDFAGNEWDFTQRPLPTTMDAYRRYLDNVMTFVTLRTARMAAWDEAQGKEP